MPSFTFAAFAALRPIDTTAFIGQWPSRLQAQASAKTLIAMADRFQLEGLCVSHLASLHGYDTLSGNEVLFQECAMDRRLWPFAVLNPANSTWREELKWSLRQGARGIRIAPGFHGYENNIEALAELAKAVRDVGLPLHLCVRVMDERIQHPRYQSQTVPLHILAELACRMEGHPLLISGLRSNEWEEVVRHLPDGLDANHLFFDLWYCNGPLGVVSLLCSKGGGRGFVYGSCTPVQTAEATALQIEQAAVEPEQRSALASGNAKRYLQQGGAK